VNPNTFLKAAVFATVAFTSTLARAGDLTLQWDPPASGPVAGYIVLYGSSSGSYSQQFNAGNSTSYTVTNLTDGYTYFFAVRAYDAAGTAGLPSSEVSATIPSAIKPVVTSLTMTSDVPAPQSVGTTVNWSASSTGGVTPYQYQWSVYKAGSWSLGAWSTSNKWSWTPPAAGSDYQVKVAVRSSGNTNTNGELSQSQPFVISAPPVASATLTASLSSPQPPNTAIVWSARGTGGATPYQYKWWLSDGSTWTAITDWTSSATWYWSPTVDNKYLVRVWIRSAGNLNDAAEAIASASFMIKGSGGQGQGGGNGNGKGNGKILSLRR
jgi:Fibronectin type III domain